MNLAIVGSRDLTKPQVKTAKALIRKLAYTDFDEHLEVISGGAEGIDTLVKEVLLEEYDAIDDFFTEFLPQTRNWTGYEGRNRLIAEACDELWCIRSAQSKTYGSGWTADYAEKLGKTVHRIVLP